jgi:hypothetical protein
MPTKISGIEQITIKAFKVLAPGPMEEAKAKLIEISTDGKLTKDNRHTVMWILQYLDGLSETLGELRLSCQKMLVAGGVNVKDR